MNWLPEAMRILHDELPNMQVTIASQYSPDLADALRRGKLDVAFMRPEAHAPDLVFKVVTTEPLVVILPSDHRLAANRAIDPHDIAGETFYQRVEDGPRVTGRHRRLPEATPSRHHAGSRGRQSRNGNVPGGVNTRRGIPACLCAEVSTMVRDQSTIKGDAPTIDLVIGYNRANTSPTLKLFLSRLDELIARVSKKFDVGEEDAPSRNSLQG